ncbi:MAG TPA: MFS transporter [Hydrogenophaga sp.]|uniref:MFS transporter n=1 Tax=Hydrogenophaga sp. TaxID=1904254 RepID=UPI002B593737|nr:MFS transporter [Hydrogenophaga sp.]HSX94032.1 MFS transporter [Hydrogenophaga sp.]
MGGNTRLVLRLGTAQTLAWASSYYLPAILARPMAEDTGLPVGTVWMAFSMALLLSALIGPFAGRAIDRFGGRPVLAATSLIFASGLGLLSLAHGPVVLFAGWLLIGVAMGAGLYEAAFAALVRLQGEAARDAITGITLLAGLASTVGWPLSGWMEAHIGWRGACLGWAALHLLLGLPLNIGLPRAATLPPPRPHEGPATDAPPRAPRHVAWVLAYVFAATWFVSTALAAHLPALLMASGLSLAGALAVGALVGPAQVAGRLLEFGGLRRFHPLISARVAAAMHPVGVLVWMAVGAAAAPVFAVLHGLGNGILTIAKGTLPLAYFGPVGYGRRQGWIVAPSRVAQAFAPLLFGALVERWGAQALWVSGGLVASALLSLMWLRAGIARHGT